MLQLDIVNAESSTLYSVNFTGSSPAAGPSAVSRTSVEPTGGVSLRCNDFTYTYLGGPQDQSRTNCA